MARAAFVSFTVSSGETLLSADASRIPCSSGWSLAMETLPAETFARSAFISPSKAVFWAGVTCLVNIPSISLCIVPKSAAKIEPPLPLETTVPAPNRMRMAASEAAPHPNDAQRGKIGRTSETGAE